MLSMLLAGSLAVAVMAPGEKVVPQEGDPAPWFEGKWMSYQDTSLAELEGKLVFIEFWRTW